MQLKNLFSILAIITGLFAIIYVLGLLPFLHDLHGLRYESGWDWWGWPIWSTINMSAILVLLYLTMAFSIAVVALGCVLLARRGASKPITIAIIPVTFVAFAFVLTSLILIQTNYYLNIFVSAGYEPIAFMVINIIVIVLASIHLAKKSETFENKKPSVIPQINAPQVTNQAAPQTTSITTKCDQLKSLKDQGVLTEAEYKELVLKEIDK